MRFEWDCITNKRKVAEEKVLEDARSSEIIVCEGKDGCTMKGENATRGVLEVRGDIGKEAGNEPENEPKSEPEYRPEKQLDELHKEPENPEGNQKAAVKTKMQKTRREKKMKSLNYENL